MTFRTVSTTAILAVLLAIIGAVSGPSWTPEPLRDQIHPTTADTRIVAQNPGPLLGTYEVKTRRITIQLDGTTIPALVREPVGAPGLTPGVVFIHGAGTGQPETAFTEAAVSLASAGITTLVPAKRIDTYSVRHRDYEAMAVDYAHSVAALRQLPRVDPDRVGLYAESEGTWIAPVMAAADPQIAFVAMVSAPVVVPRSQAAYAVDSYLRNTGVPEEVFRAIPRAVGMELPGGGFDYADFDVRPFLTGITQPVLVVYGTDDASMPIIQGALEILELTAAHGNDAVLVRYYGDANHGIRVKDRVVPEFLRDLASWIGGLPETATSEPRIAGAEPAQAFLASEVPQSHWFGSGDLIVRLVVLAGALILLGPAMILVRAVFRRIRRTRAKADAAPRIDRPLRFPLIGLVVASVLTAAGLVSYLVMIARLALEYEQDPWLVQGGWIAIRLMGLAACICGALLIDVVLTRRGLRKSSDAGSTSDAGGNSSLVRGATGYMTIWATTAGCALLLVILAYWGVFQLGI